MEYSLEKIDITGIIMANKWDECGRIVEIALYTDNEEVYPVEHNSLTEELMNFMHQSVEIKGSVREYSNGGKSITAHEYMPRK